MVKSRRLYAEEAIQASSLKGSFSCSVGALMVSLAELTRWKAKLHTGLSLKQ